MVLPSGLIKPPVVDKFEELLDANQSPLCLFPMHKVCQEFNMQMLCRLDAEIKEIPCIDEAHSSGTKKQLKK